MDESVNGHLIKALAATAGKSCAPKISSIEGTADEVHFEYTAKQERVLVTNDEDHKILGHRWLSEGKTFAGLIEWAPKKYAQATIGDIAEKFEALAEQDEPFDPDYPIIHL